MDTHPAAYDDDALKCLWEKAVKEPTYMGVFEDMLMIRRFPNGYPYKNDGSIFDEYYNQLINKKPLQNNSLSPETIEKTLKPLTSDDMQNIGAQLDELISANVRPKVCSIKTDI